MKDLLPLEAVDDDGLYDRAITCLSNLTARVKRKCQVHADFEHAQRVIETLPLRSDEYRTARDGLRNARRYQRSAEIGASRFELNLLVRTLKANRVSVVPEPIRT